MLPWTKVERTVLSFPANRNTVVDRATREPGQWRTVQSPRRPEERTGVFLGFVQGPLGEERGRQFAKEDDG